MLIFSKLSLKGIFNMAAFFPKVPTGEASGHLNKSLLISLCIKWNPDLGILVNFREPNEGEPSMHQW